LCTRDLPKNLCQGPQPAVQTSVWTPTRHLTAGIFEQMSAAALQAGSRGSTLELVWQLAECAVTGLVTPVGRSDIVAAAAAARATSRVLLAGYCRALQLHRCAWLQPPPSLPPLSPPGHLCHLHRQPISSAINIGLSCTCPNYRLWKPCVSRQLRH
jgi:hypothetical protein